MESKAGTMDYLKHATFLEGGKQFKEGNLNRDWLTVVNLVREGVFLYPPHQRGEIWPEEKQKRFIKRLASSVDPLGTVATYQIQGTGPVRVNDGRQRITTCTEFLDNPEKFGICVGDAVRILLAAECVVQHRHCPDQDFAYLDFQIINQGMAMTGKEFYHGVLAYMPSYATHWEEKLEEFQTVITEEAIKVVSKKNLGRVAMHKLWRHGYAIMLRFLKKEREMTSVRVNIPDCTEEDPEDRNVIEWFLREELLRGEKSVVDGELDKLNRTIERETATINNLWDKVQGNRAKRKGLSSGLYRFLIEASIWKRNNSVLNDKWMEYVEAMLIATNGGTYIEEINEEDKQGRRKLCILSLGDMRLVKKTDEIVGTGMISAAGRRRKKRDPRIRRGYDQSHVEPFATNGDGPTIVEPASINRARGAKPIAP